MRYWTEDEFQRTALSTKLSERTLAACRDVLVDGLSGVEAGLRHQILPAQISRGLKGLRERRAEMSESVELMKDSSEAMKAYAIQEARVAAPGFAGVEDAEPGRQYEGPGVMKTPGYFVQRVGTSLVIHDLGKLQQSPNMNARLEIAYPRDGGLASVKEKALDHGKGGVGR